MKELVKCPACSTKYDPRTSSQHCPHHWTAAEPPILRRMREAGPPYKSEPWKVEPATEAQQ
jgi:hypothetical protein